MTEALPQPQPSSASPSGATGRPSWDEYFVQLVPLVAGRATCDRGRSGCVIVRDHRIVCSGYVGSPPGLPHCDDVGHLWRNVVEDDGGIRTHCVRTIHAEQNALAQAAKYGLPLAGTTVYCTMEPCATCAMLLISVGVERVVALRRYHAAQQSRDLLAAAGVQLDVWYDEDQQYPNQLNADAAGAPAPDLAPGVVAGTVAGSVAAALADEAAVPEAE